MRLSRRCRSNPAPAPGTKNRRFLWEVVLVVATAGLSVGAVCAVVAYRNPVAKPIGAGADDPRAPEVEELIRRYFRTWSNQDIKGYGECFLENAAIQFIDTDGKIKPFALPEFLADQDTVFRAGQHETEAPESIDIRFEAELARVVVYWKLTVGPREVLGYDHFTLLQRDGKWGIVNLTWYETSARTSDRARPGG